MAKKVWRWIFVGIAVLLALAIAALIWYSVTQKNPKDVPAEQPPVQTEPAADPAPEKTDEPTVPAPEQTEPEQPETEQPNTEPSEETDPTEGTSEEQYPDTGPNGMGWN